MKTRSKSNIFLSALLILSLAMQLFLVPAASKSASAAEEGPDPNFHIYIAFGQSNMEGNPAIEDKDKVIDEEHYLMMQTADANMTTPDGEVKEVGKWYPAIPPLANSNANLSMADYFGRELLAMKQKENPNAKIGLIVVAVAGASIRAFDKDTCTDYLANEADWMQNIAAQYGGNPYQRIVDMAKQAKNDGLIKGIILHQGETDAGDSAWAEKVKKIYDDMVADIGLPEDTPLIAGEVVTNGAAGGANANINKLPEQGENFHVVSSEGLEAQSDNLHFTSESQRIYGKRYADLMAEVEHPNTYSDPVYEWSADNTSVKASRFCNEAPNYVEEETASVSKQVTKEATGDTPGEIVYTAEFKNPAFAKQTKTETIPPLGNTQAPQASQTPQVSGTASAGGQAQPKAKPEAKVEKALKLSAVKCKKNSNKITGKVSQKGATVKIKVGKDPARKASVKGKKFTLKLSYKLKKKTKVTITVSKKNFKQLKKTYTVK